MNLTRPHTSKSQNDTNFFYFLICSAAFLWLTFIGVGVVERDSFVSSRDDSVCNVRGN